MNQQKKLMVMTGGTGGHVFPGISVAHYLINKGWQVRWIGTANRIEADLVPKNGIEIDFICISGLRGSSVKELMLSPIRILNAYCQAFAIMKRFEPNVVLGMGGYVSGPSGLAAWTLRIPIVLHEQNSVAGLTNILLAKIASKVIQAFPNTLPDAKIVGNPIRIDIMTLPQPEFRLKGRKGPMRILVMGGSQGAQIFNKTIPQVAAKLGNSVIIWHQSGKGSQKIVEQAYYDIRQSQHKVTEFIDDIANAYNWADIVICRSGALTVSEIAAVGLPAVFVPFKHKDYQQYWNALPLEQVGAAKIIEQTQFTADRVAAMLASWDRKTLLEMAKRALTIAKLDATEQLAQEVILAAKI